MYVEFVEGDKYPSNDADISSRHTHYRDAGYILKNDDLVIDIDHLPKETIREMLRRFNIKTETVWTDRGAHLYFKRPKMRLNQHMITPLGFEAEFFTTDNKKAVTVKRNGVARERENPNVRQALPDCLRPQKKLQDNLLGLTENGGRNNALFKLANSILNLDDRDKILDFVNRYIFDEPLSQDEFNLVIRPRTPRAERDMENEMAKIMIQDLNIHMYSGLIYFFDEDEDEFSNDYNRLEYIASEYCEGQKTRYVKEVLEQIRMRCPRISRREKPFVIALDNGYLKDGTFVPMKFSGFTPYRIHTSYNPDVEAVPIVDEYLDQLTGGDETYRKRLLEAFAHGLITDKERKRMLAKFFIFVGDGGNGKGTLLQVIRKIFGERNCGAVSIEELQDERYLNTLYDKLINLGDDIDDSPINNRAMRRLKNISTCDTMEVRRLYENSFTDEITSTLIFASNHLIKSFEKGESYKRRVDWMPMFAKPKRKDPKFITKLTTPEAIEYWIKLLVEAYERLYENGFTESDVVNKYTKQYHIENDNTIVYIQSLNRDEVVNRPTNDVYLDYQTWCDENGESPASRKRLYENIYSKFKVKKKQKREKGVGRPIYTFVPIEEENN